MQMLSMRKTMLAAEVRTLQMTGSGATPQKTWCNGEYQLIVTLKMCVWIMQYIDYYISFPYGVIC